MISFPQHLTGFANAVIVSAFVIISLPAMAEEQNQNSWFDASHGQIADSLDNSALWFDNFFGDPRRESDTRADARLQVILDAFYSGVEGESDYSIRFRGSVDLPQLENQLRLFLSSDIEGDNSGNTLVDNDPLARNQAVTNSGAGLRYGFLQSDNHSLSFSASIKSGPALLLNTRSLYRLPLTEISQLRFTNTLYWHSDDGAGVSALIDYELQDKADTLWRLSLFGNYGEITQDLEWSSQATWLRQLDSRSAISLRAGLNGNTANAKVTEGWTSFRYRRNFYRPWLFYEVEPGVSWHEKESYDPEPTLGLRLEMHF